MKNFVENIVRLRTQKPGSAIQAQQLCLWELARRLQNASPSSRTGILKYKSEMPKESNSLIQNFPLGSMLEPLSHLERVWLAARGELICCEPQGRRDTELGLRNLIQDSYKCLKAQGCLILALGSPQESRQGAAIAIKAGFEVSFLRAIADPQNNESKEFTNWVIQHEEPIETLQESYKLNQDQVLFLVATRKETQVLNSGLLGRKAFVYNCYLDTCGGGERSSLDFAAALDELGYEVELVSTTPIATDLENLKEAFGLDKKFSWPIRYFPTEQKMKAAVKSEKVEVFVNHTFSSYCSNVAPVGIYVAMFPLPTLPAHIQSLLSYDRICCISEFTQEYVGRFWYKDINTEVIYPPISHIHQLGDLGNFANKQRLVLQIGRFNTEGHSKCQLEAIRAFSRMKKNNVLSSGWKMKVVGRLNSGLRNERYIERCREEAEGNDIEIVTNASFEMVRDYYRQACCLWQFTGFGLGFGQSPQNCEHLGLVAMDCFSYGTIPIIYQRGGMVPLINHAENGFCFGSEAELVDIMREVASNFGGAFHRKIYEQSKSSTCSLGFSEYRDSIDNMIWRILRGKTSVKSRKELTNERKTVPGK